ncbi:hypothetical protein IMZ48_02060 [Candidatus Bathyarchaeota archaeon]|nr:hypothetical protein [Candidatus Bathyarchaeota archaeon]
MVGGAGRFHDAGSPRHHGETDMNAVHFVSGPPISPRIILHLEVAGDP